MNCYSSLQSLWHSLLVYTTAVKDLPTCSLDWNDGYSFPPQLSGIENKPGCRCKAMCSLGDSMSVGGPVPPMGTGLGDPLTQHRVDYFSAPTWGLGTFVLASLVECVFLASFTVVGCVRSHLLETKLSPQVLGISGPLFPLCSFFPPTSYSVVSRILLIARNRSPLSLTSLKEKVLRVAAVVAACLCSCPLPVGWLVLAFLLCLAYLPCRFCS